MNEPDFTYCTPEFYLKKITDAEIAAQRNDIVALGTAVFSFFSGSNYEMSTRTELQSKHFQCIFEIKELFLFFTKHPNTLLIWIGNLFYYSRSMSAIPEIVTTVWPCAARTVELWKEAYPREGVYAATQLASWDYHYEANNHPKYLTSIKQWEIQDPYAAALRDLLCSTSINKDLPDYKNYIEKSYNSRGFFGPHNEAISILTYYCHINPSPDILRKH